jgi:hypothetical protein
MQALQSGLQPAPARTSGPSFVSPKSSCGQSSGMADVLSTID